MTAPVDWIEDVPDDDPSVTDWREATGQSTSAQLRTARDLVAYALHLRMHGECAPGGSETWRQFDRDAEALLRSLPARPTPHLDAVKAELAKTQSALAASQADLTAALAEGDKAINALIKTRVERDRLQDGRDGWKRVAEQHREDGEATARAADKTREALAERQRLHASTVARLANVNNELVEERKLHAVTADKLANAVGELEQLRAKLGWQTGRST